VPVALVTGGASGIGAACAAALARNDVRVAVADRGPAPWAALDVALDVRDADALVAAVQRVELELGPIEYLVTAAGYYAAGDIADAGDDAWRDMLAVHVGGTANAWRAVLPGMVQRGRGRVCAIGSELGLCGDPSAPHYAAAKGAIHAMTKSVAVELARSGVRINCVAPGPTDTPLLDDDPNTPGYAEALALKRLLTPDEIAAAVCFVLLEQTNVLGQVVSPNGGVVL
jgi:NAD(P)-dependent dehydrogenase (short-subunit alcohol dehydrogenase family)